MSQETPEQKAERERREERERLAQVCFIDDMIEPSGDSFTMAKSQIDLDIRMNRVPITDQAAGSFLRDFPHDTTKMLTSGMGAEKYGTRKPANFQEGMDRKTYVYMDIYNRIRTEVIAPLIDELLKPSSALLKQEKLIYNDLAIGSFDFAKASINLLPKYLYYSVKKKETVDFSETKYVTEKGKSVLVLKEDGSSVITVPEFFESLDNPKVKEAYKKVASGANPNTIGKEMGLHTKYFSNIKKSYLWKQKIPKPKNAVRIFSFIGGSWGKTAEQLMYTGLTAMAVAELMQMAGYSVNLVTCYGSRFSGTFKDQHTGRMRTGNRFIGFDQKPFTSTLDASDLLCALADPAYYRIHVFRHLAMIQNEYGDTFDSRLGFEVGVPAFKKAVYENYGKADKLFNPSAKGSQLIRDQSSPLLYFTLCEIFSEAEMVQAIRDIIMCAEEENNKAREAMGFQMIQD